MESVLAQSSGDIFRPAPTLPMCEGAPPGTTQAPTGQAAQGADHARGGQGPGPRGKDQAPGEKAQSSRPGSDILVNRFEWRFYETCMQERLAELEQKHGVIFTPVHTSTKGFTKVRVEGRNISDAMRGLDVLKSNFRNNIKHYVMELDSSVNICDVDEAANHSQGYMMQRVHLSVFIIGRPAQIEEGVRAMLPYSRHLQGAVNRKEFPPLSSLPRGSRPPDLENVYPVRPVVLNEPNVSQDDSDVIPQSPTSNTPAKQGQMEVIMQGHTPQGQTEVIMQAQAPNVKRGVASSEGSDVIAVLTPDPSASDICSTYLREPASDGETKGVVPASPPGIAGATMTLGEESDMNQTDVTSPETTTTTDNKIITNIYKSDEDDSEMERPDPEMAPKRSISTQSDVADLVPESSSAAEERSSVDVRSRSVAVQTEDLTEAVVVKAAEDPSAFPAPDRSDVSTGTDIIKRAEHPSRETFLSEEVTAKAESIVSETDGSLEGERSTAVSSGAVASRAVSSVAGESRAGSSVAGESRAGSFVAGESRAGSSVAGESRAGSFVAGESRAGSSVAGESRAGSFVAGESRAGSSVAGESRAGSFVAGESRAGSFVAGESRAGSSGNNSDYEEDNPPPIPEKRPTDPEITTDYPDTKPAINPDNNSDFVRSLVTPELETYPITTSSNRIYNTDDFVIDDQVYPPPDYDSADEDTTMMSRPSAPAMTPRADNVTMTAASPDGEVSDTESSVDEPPPDYYLEPVLPVEFLPHYVRQSDLDDRAFRWVYSDVIIYVVQGDVTQLRVDAVVCPCDARMTGRVPERILAAAGPGYQRERDGAKWGPGGVHVTRGHDLPCQAVIHVATPSRRKYHEEHAYKEDLYQAYFSAIWEAEREGLHTVAIPAVDSEDGGVQMRLITLSLFKAVQTFLKGASHVTSLVLVDTNPDFLRDLGMKLMLATGAGFVKVDINKNA